MKPNVLQHQYAISCEGNGGLFLATKGILICTGWYGWDYKNGICFLCHFDHPGSAKSVPKILRELKSTVPDEHKFKSILVGGKKWWWSRATRKKIKQYLAQQSDLDIIVKDGPFDPFLLRRDLRVSANTGHLRDVEGLSGSSSPKGVSWFFGPMQRVEVNGFDRARNPL